MHGILSDMMVTFPFCATMGLVVGGFGPEGGRGVEIERGRRRREGGHYLICYVVYVDEKAT